jgi:hypothetical protein
MALYNMISKQTNTADNKVPTPNYSTLSHSYSRYLKLTEPIFMQYVILLTRCKTLQRLVSGLYRQVITEHNGFVVSLSNELLEHGSCMARLQFGHW